jgi:hypothetical protein
MSVNDMANLDHVELVRQGAEAIREGIPAGALTCWGRPEVVPETRSRKNR